MGYEAHVTAMYEAGWIVPGDELEVWLFQIEDYLNTIHDLRGDPR
jgi:hypothetical protein